MTIKCHHTIVFLVALNFLSGFSQTQISGVINQYAKVISISGANSLRVDNPSLFKSGDTVMIIQMKGAKIDASNSGILSMKNAGGYEFIIIDKLIGDVIQFLPPSFSNIYDVNESVQVVRVPYYIYAKVAAPITCPAWDGSKGGVIALFVRDTLTLGDNMDASGFGYRGGSATISSYNVCKITPAKNFFDAESDSAGLKGEGFASTTFTYNRGNGSSGNGGGGGNGHGAGGGGGAGGGAINAVGGVGDLHNGCTDPPSLSLSQGGNGGSIWANTTYENRVFMGGGGGSGIGTSPTDVSNGASGGGIIFLMTYHLRSNGKALVSRGTNVSSNLSNNVGGGGGGGGTILLATEKISNTLIVDVTGGKGGNSNTCFSAGGGGGGGLLWHSGGALTTSPFLLVGGGSQGGIFGTSCTSTAASSGGSGGEEANLIPVLNGFLFNSLLGKADTICYGYVPKTIVGTIPRGGRGDYFYQWHKKLKSATGWQLIPGETSKDLSPSALTDTTLYRRVVKSVRPIIEDTITDISGPYQVNVIPEMKSFNIITPDTIVCYGLPSIKMRAEATTDGDLGSIKSYIWEKSTDGTANSWSNAGGVNTSQYYTNPSNTTTYFYRRKVNNNICQKISNVVKITVLPLIINTIQSNQTICSGSTAAQLQNAATVAGGDGSYSYQWQQSTDISSPANWVNAVTTPALNPGSLTNTMYYQRLIISGFANTCQSTSNSIKITVLPLLGNNIIQSPQTVCQETAPARFLGTLPTGGDGVYRYQWDISDDNASWSTITINTDSIHYKNAKLPTAVSKFFRRMVRSGAGDCCVSSSPSIKITVEPKIVNNMVADSQEICYAQAPLLLTQKSGSLSGGNGPYNYTWEQRAFLVQVWSNANLSNTSATYSPGSLLSTTYFRRKVNSGTCVNFSDSIPIRVLSALDGNNLTGANEVCDKLIPSSITGGAITGGKTGDYRYVWQDSITGGVWNNISSASAKDYTPYVLSQNTNFRRVVKSGRTDGCMNTSAPFTIVINPVPTGILRNLDTAICKSTTLHFRLVINSGTSPFEVKLSDGVSTVTQPGLVNGTSNFNSIPSQDGTYHILSLTDSKGCKATSYSGAATVRLVTIPNAKVAANDEICGPVYQLKAIPSVGHGKWITTADATFLPSNTDPGAKVTVQKYGRIPFIWEETNEFCSDSAMVNITFFEQPVNIRAGEAQKLQYLFTTSLGAPTPNAGKGIWTVKNNSVVIEDPQNQNSTISNLQFGPNVFYWTVTNGTCPSITDSVIVFVEDITRYTGFSPNNDGNNNTFVIEGLENSKTRELKVFNRWGSEVYSSANYQNDWNGNNANGKPLTADTYYYVLKTDDNRVYKGFVVIRR